MPVSISWDEYSLAYLISPPLPSYVLRDIVLGIHNSPDINALAMLGRDLLRSLVIARLFRPPIAEDFETRIDQKLTDAKLAHVVRETDLLVRLNVEDVATDTTDVARLLYAYLGATLKCAWSESHNNNIHESVNDICSLLLDYDGSINGLQSHE